MKKKLRDAVFAFNNLFHDFHNVFIFNIFIIPSLIKRNILYKILTTLCEKKENVDTLCHINKTLYTEQTNILFHSSLTLFTYDLGLILTTQHLNTSSRDINYS